MKYRDTINFFLYAHLRVTQHHFHRRTSLYLGYSLNFLVLYTLLCIYAMWSNCACACVCARLALNLGHKIKQHRIRLTFKLINKRKHYTYPIGVVVCFYNGGKRSRHLFIYLLFVFLSLSVVCILILDYLCSDCCIWMCCFSFKVSDKLTHRKCCEFPLYTPFFWLS